MNRLINKYLKCIFAVFILLFSFDLKAEEPFNVQDVVFSHLGDAYSWHITKVGDTELVIPLPVIVKGEESGWNVFLSSRLNEGASYQGFKIAQDGEYAGKVVETLSSGEEVRPIDISMTKNVWGLFISCSLVLFIILKTAKWYKNHPCEAPGGFIGMMETVIYYIYDDVIRKNAGGAHMKFYPYLLTLFFFILINNFLGLIPIFPGGANLTGNITITMTLAACTFLAINVFGSKSYWKDIFWPNVPLYLKCPIPIMPFVEFIGILTKPFALMIRLFANIMAGHTVILALTCLIFMTVSMGMAINYSMTVLSVAFCVFMNCLELFVACLQAYIFTLLSASFIGLAQAEE